MAARRLSLLSLWHVYLKCVTAAIELSDTSALKNVPNCVQKSDLKPLSPTFTYLINLPIENVVQKALGSPELGVQTQRATYLKCDPSFNASQYSDYCPASFLIYISLFGHISFKNQRND